jgi:hypothetical protein
MALDPDDPDDRGAGPERHSRRGVYLRGLPCWCLTVGQVSETRAAVQPAIPNNLNVSIAFLCLRCNQLLPAAVSLRILTYRLVSPWYAGCMGR